MDNYICINGKKAELTEEQMKALGIELPNKSPFAFCGNRDEPYYFITSIGSVMEATGHVSKIERHRAANYCTDKELLEQRALHETLNRLLWRYSMEHGGDKIDWGNVSDKWAIYYGHDIKKYKAACWQTINYFGNIHFDTKEIAEAAIKEIIEPFMKAHPEFKW